MTLTLFCLDFDETLANTDRLRADLTEAIRSLGKDELTTIYQEAYETTREEHGVPRIPLVLKTMVERYGLDHKKHRQLADVIHNFPYQNYIYPGSEELVAKLRKQGKVVIVSDGDSFFQPHKIYATSVARLVDDVIILTSKVDSFDDLSGYYPAEHYVFIDDKQRVLDAAKAYFGEQATTVLVRQGRYASDSNESTADHSVATIAEVASLFS